MHTVTDSQATALLQAGKVGVLSTDTIYGIVCRAADQTAVEQLYKLKQRDHKPGTIIAASIDQLVELGLKARYLKAVESFWPNSITIIIPTGPDLAYLHQNKGTLAVRIPKASSFTDLLKQTGPLLTTSANQPGKSPATTIQGAMDYFGEQMDFYVDGGDLVGRQPSTIIRMIDDAVEVIREGAVTIDEATGRIT